MSRRGENIYKRKDGRWEARYVKETDILGNKKYGSVYAKTYKEVKAKQQFCKQNSITNHNSLKKYNIKTVMHEWLNSVKNQLKKSTFQKYESITENHIVNNIGKLDLNMITSSVIIQFTDDRLDSGLSKQTVNYILIVLGMGLDFAEKEYGILMPKIHTIRTDKKEMRVFSVTEQQILVNYITKNDNVFNFGILLALYTGMRIGELCALQWEDISDGTIRINKTMQRMKGSLSKTEIVITSPKTASSNRTIPIPEQLLSVIERHRLDSGYVLSQNNGKYIEPRLLQQKFSECIKKCGIEHATFHTLRHTFATRCIEIGFDAKTLSEILGHADVKTTLNKYVHSSFELKQKSMDMLTLNIAI